MTQQEEALWKRTLRGAAPALVIIAALLGVIALVGLVRARGRGGGSVEVAPVDVQVVRIAPLKTLTDSLKVNGIVEPNRLVRVAAEVSSRVERYGQLENADRPLDEGDVVLQGQPLVYLNTEIIQADYDRAAAALRFAKSERERVKAMYDKGAAVETELDDANNRVAAAQATFDTAKAKLERTVIHAPISGVLNRLPVEIGEYVSSGETVAEIVDSDTVKVAVDVPEKDVFYLKVGQDERVTATSASTPDKPVVLTGKITYISELADQAARTTRVEITIPNRLADSKVDHIASAPSWQTGRVLRSGQMVQVELVRRRLTNAIMIPLRTVIPTEHGYVVYIVQDGLAQRRDVKIGLIRGLNVQVVSGLKEGDLLIVEGQRYVGPGQQVRVVSEPQLTAVLAPQAQKDAE